MVNRLESQRLCKTATDLRGLHAMSLDATLGLLKDAGILCSLTPYTLFSQRP